VKHHLFDDTDPNLIIRPAQIDDTPDITRLSTGDIPLSEEALDAAQLIVAERLAIESGDDYFTIVAERRDNGRVVGWLAGGGCRGQKLKGWGELYAVGTDPTEPSTIVEEAMLGVALNALKLAQFAGVTTLVEDDDTMRSELFEDLGFTTEPPEGAAPANGPAPVEGSTPAERSGEITIPEHFMRYSLTFVTT
jgi:hypothetical protein